MDDSSKREFSQVLRDTFEIYDKEVSVGKLRIYFQSLKKFRLEDVSAALSAHVAKSKFAPRPADILELLGGMDGRPDENEAWAIALASQDEKNTVVWTDEMAVAFASAKIILDAGDQQGAKMAFREVYSSQVEKARVLLKPVNWRVSLGFDQERVNNVINQAVTDHRLSLSVANKYLIDPITEEGRAVVGLLTGNVVDVCEATREKLAEVRRMINATKTHQEKFQENRRMKFKADSEELDLAKQRVSEFIENNA